MDNEIKGEGNSVSYTHRINDPRIGRWLSIDPDAHKYPYTTNYSSNGNNPILNIDVLGKYIIVYNLDGTFFRYKPGMEVPNDTFSAEIVKSLNKIHTTDVGKIVVNQLVNSATKYNVKRTGRMLNTSFRPQANLELYNDLLESERYSEIDQLIKDIEEADLLVFDGNWAAGWGKIDQVAMNMEIAFSHELYHAFTFDDGKCDGSYLASEFNIEGNNPEDEWAGGQLAIPLNEIQAVGFENYIRQKLYDGGFFGLYNDTRALYTGHTINAFKEDTWFFPGNLDLDEFVEDGSAFEFWRNELKEISKKNFQKLLNKGKKGKAPDMEGKISGENTEIVNPRHF